MTQLVSEKAECRLRSKSKAQQQCSTGIRTEYFQRNRNAAQIILNVELYSSKLFLKFILKSELD